jgi:DNA-binding transcriptional MerR regulator
MAHTLFTPAEFARRVGVTPDTIRHWERIGKVKALKTVSGRRLFEQASVERVLRERTRREHPNTAPIASANE